MELIAPKIWIQEFFEIKEQIYGFNPIQVKSFLLIEHFIKKRTDPIFLAAIDKEILLEMYKNERSQN